VAELTQPTPEQVKAARTEAGHTQAQAAALVHAGSYRSWQDWERGQRPMPLAAWELYLIKTGP
jgi:DNA-binding transcriptional regulator YiaG